MFRIPLTAVALTLGLCLSAAADSKPSSGADHHEETIRLTDRQVDAGGFAVADVRGGELRKHISVPGTIVPSGDRIARVAVRLLGTVIDLRKRLGDRVDAGYV
jgi:cobalt-zinc-cadmium efflux system membrane fusion protein